MYRHGSSPLSSSNDARIHQLLDELIILDNKRRGIDNMSQSSRLKSSIAPVSTRSQYQESKSDYINQMINAFKDVDSNAAVVTSHELQYPHVHHQHYPVHQSQSHNFNHYHLPPPPPLAPTVRLLPMPPRDLRSSMLPHQSQQQHYQPYQQQQQQEKDYRNSSLIKHSRMKDF